MGHHPRHHNFVCVDCLQAPGFPLFQMRLALVEGVGDPTLELDLPGKGREGTWHTHGPVVDPSGADSRGLD